MTHLDRRSFLAVGAAGVPAIAVAAHASPTPRFGAIAPARPVSISSGNGMPAVTRAMERMGEGAAPVEAVVAGVTLVEDDEGDMSVGYGGLPNEEGVVQLDASVMDGPMHKAGAVAGIERIRNPAQVALKVLEHTDHVLLVGDGARRFAVAQGFEEEDLLTEKARKAWMKWKRNLNPNDDWLDDGQTVEVDPRQAMAESIGVPWHYGTIHCSAVDANGDLGATTTTSGLSYKIPGRVGDSPIIGAGMFVDNEVGAGGSTGRGESVIQSCGAFQVVRHMADGVEPTEACLKVLKWIADHTKRKSLLNSKGEPNFNVVMYALRKDGAYGGAVMRGRNSFAVHDGTEAKRVPLAPLF